jgi:drug/metabolite transporter (DMT)-like permease
MESNRMYFALLIFGGITFGTASIFIKESGMSPGSITFLRFLVAGLILMRGRFSLQLPWKEYVLLGALLALHMFTFVEGVYNTTIMDATVLVSTSPFFVLVMSMASGLKVPPRDLLAIGMGFLGVVLINIPLNEGDLVGNLISVVSAILIAAYTFRLRDVKSEDPLRLTAGIYLFSSLFSLPVFALEGVGRVNLVSLESLVGLIAFPTLVGHTSIVVSSGKVKPHYIETIGLLEPVVATILSIPLFGEVPLVTQLIGSAMVISSIFLIVK